LKNFDFSSSDFLETGILAFHLRRFTEIGGSTEWLQKVGGFLETLVPEGAKFLHRVYRKVHRSRGIGLWLVLLVIYAIICGSFNMR